MSSGVSGTKKLAGEKNPTSKLDNMPVNNQLNKALNAVDALKATSMDSDWEAYDDLNSTEAVNPLLKGKENDWNAQTKIEGSIVPSLRDKYGDKFANNKKISADKEVSISSLSTIQPYIQRNDLKKYITIMANGKMPKSKHGLSDVVVLRYSGKNYVYDGNHRVAAAKLLGIKKVNVKYIDVDSLNI